MKTPSADAPQISLIVATTARSDRLEPLFARLRASRDALGAAAEVVVVDNSRDGALAHANEQGILIVRAALPGLSRARTTACMRSRGEVLVFTDDDVDFDPDWAMRMARPILAGEAHATAAPVRLGPEFDFVTDQLQREWLAEANLADGQQTRLVGAGMAIHRDMLGIGLWDEQLGAGAPTTSFGEETLFEAMIREAGAVIEVCRDAEVVHHPDTTRLDDQSWRDTAAAKGQSAAYVAYHWYGAELKRARLRTLRRRARLRAHRRRSGAGGFVEELRLIESVGYAEGMVREQARPRAYIPRPHASLTAREGSVAATIKRRAGS